MVTDLQSFWQHFFRVWRLKLDKLGTDMQKQGAYILFI